MRIKGGILSLGLAALLGAGCSDSPTSSPTTNDPITNPNVISQPGANNPGPEQFSAVMSGAQEVPAVQTPASGSTSFHMSTDGQGIIYAISVANISNVTAAHIHLGDSGVSGPPVVDLFIGMRAGEINGLLVQGRISADELEGSLAGMTLNDLSDLLRSGGAYVNVHTTQHPDGEIRGQVRARVADDGGPS